MGGHYGSIHVRTEDRPRVKAAAEQVATAMKIRVLLGPALNGWVGLYPEHNGQDDAVSRELARHLPDTLLHLMVHDDDIFAYWLYAGGQLVDSFWSAPGYFGEENRAAEEKMAGNPEAFRPILGDRTDRLAPLLDRAEEASPPMASDRLEQFARLLKIPNAVTAYEYLQEGDREGIRGWRTFEDLPAAAMAAERARKRAEANRIKAERRALRTRGLLLVDDQRKQGVPYGCAVPHGFVVARADHIQDEVAFDCYGEPWADGPTPLSINPLPHVRALRSDPTGRRIAMAARDGIRLWDVDANTGSWRLTAEIPDSHGAGDVALSADGRTVAYQAEKKLIVADTPTARRLFEHPVDGHRSVTLHPAGGWGALTGNTLALVELGGQPRWLELYVGGKSRAAVAGALLMQSKLKGINIEQFRQQQRAAMESGLARLEKMTGRAKQFAPSEEQSAAMRRDMEKHLDEMVNNLIAIKEGRGPAAPMQGEEQVTCVGFSRDGRWLWCGTNAGLRVYEWSALPRQHGASTPRPTWRFEPADPALLNATAVHSIAEELDAAAVAFTVPGGLLYRMSLATGDVRELVRLPDHTSMYDLCFSPDGQTLGTASQWNRPEGRWEQRRGWLVWNYAKLRDAPSQLRLLTD